MQCHKCPKNGRPDETCITCNAAEYLDNGHKTIIPMDNFDGFPYRRKSPTHPYSEACSVILGLLKKSDPRTRKAALALTLLFASLTDEQLSVFLDILGGGTLTSCAKGEGVSKQAMHQKWNRLAAKHPVLKNLPKRNRHERTKSGILSRDARQGGG